MSVTSWNPIRIWEHRLWRRQSRRRLQRGEPLISLVLAVKNGLPHLRKAIDALSRQTYRHFELVVQDGGSTDGSLAFLESTAGMPALDIASAPDCGIGQAYSRGIARSRGDIVCLISCDEYLEDDALQKAVAWYATNPDAAAICGAVRLTDAAGHLTQLFAPQPFDVTRVLHCETVPPMGAAFLNRSRIGGDLYFDETLRTCPDFDFWTRVGRRFDPGAFVMLPDPVVVARSDTSSMSYRAESFEQFCRDKIFTLKRYLNRTGGQDRAGLAKTAAAGIYTWAAENVFTLEGASPGFLGWCAKAAELDPQSARLRQLARTSLAFDIDPASGRFTLQRKVQPALPPGGTEPAGGLLCLEEIESPAYWDARIERTDQLRIVTGEAPWGYAARIPLHLDGRLDKDYWYWAKVEVEVLTGQVGIGLLVGDHLCHERMIGPADGRTAVFVTIGHSSGEALLIRNGSVPGQSVLIVFGATGERCRIM